eukprot:3831184-Prymnesium_polylepis.1
MSLGCGYPVMLMRLHRLLGCVRAYALVRDVRVLGCECCGKPRSTKLKLKLSAHIDHVARADSDHAQRSARRAQSSSPGRAR